ncbi:hypothetical protein ACP70R_039200 [Stipagrostis hirtigluma subsp. patula]
MGAQEIFRPTCVFPPGLAGIHSPSPSSAALSPASCSPVSHPEPTLSPSNKPYALRTSAHASRSRIRGGLELLLENATKAHKVEVHPNDGEAKVTMRGLLSWVKANMIKERPEMFVKGDSVFLGRPGVLVLINDCDWELCGGLDAELEDKDVVVFISTLHGG